MAEHTPGPWEYHRVTIGSSDNVKNPMVRGSGQYICRVGWQGSTIPGMTSRTAESFEEAEANARLIAAAPELLAALEGLVKLYDDNQIIRVLLATVAPDELAHARAAIAKAKGGDAQQT
ncbi:MAG: hypothetical protein U1B30_15800 [Pseudomonadota bacterium]|nr:hypothetical protein [Pseudomonadota bacterium]